uniref:Uncharacterized protein n=1 Tax=Zea mays TaxID=4577 RepID=B8A1G0_MAIZE|nr:unknown [Zea mays]
MGRQRPRRLLHLRRRQGHRVLKQARPRPCLPRPPGRGGRLRVLRRPAAGDHILGAQLLRRVQQRRRADERRRQPALLVPDPQAVQGQSTNGVTTTGCDRDTGRRRRLEASFRLQGEYACASCIPLAIFFLLPLRELSIKSAVLLNLLHVCN